MRKRRGKRETIDHEEVNESNTTFQAEIGFALINIKTTT
jgi:hypothetical protein